MNLKTEFLNALSMSEFWAFITQTFWLLMNFDACRKLLSKRISYEKVRKRLFWVRRITSSMPRSNTPRTETKRVSSAVEIFIELRLKYFSNMVQTKILEHGRNKSRARSENCEHGPNKFPAQSKQFLSTFGRNLDYCRSKPPAPSKKLSSKVETNPANGQIKSREQPKQFSSTFDTNLEHGWNKSRIRYKSRARLKQISSKFARNLDYGPSKSPATSICFSSTVEINLEHCRNKSRARSKRISSPYETNLERDRNIHWAGKKHIFKMNIKKEYFKCTIDVGIFSFHNTNFLIVVDFWRF